MSLKAFHIVLISAAIFLAAGFGLWSCRQYYSVTQNLTDLWIGLAAFTIGVLLMVYLAWFVRKIKERGW